MKQSVTKWQYVFGLIGKRLDYSFSPDYFAQLFHQEHLEKSHHYSTWEIADPRGVQAFLNEGKFQGANVTNPYKSLAAECCDELVGFARHLGVVNTVVNHRGQLIGYNTDVYGVLRTWIHLFANKQKRYKSLHQLPHQTVLICGAGGASKAVAASCQYLGWSVVTVSRSAENADFDYSTLKKTKNLSEFQIIVNATPVGMTSLIDEMPPLNVEEFSPGHLVFDLIYNPKKTLILDRAEQAGATCINGKIMLEEQANLAWRIWKQHFKF